MKREVQARKKPVRGPKPLLTGFAWVREYMDIFDFKIPALIKRKSAKVFSIFSEGQVLIYSL